MERLKLPRIPLKLVLLGLLGVALLMAGNALTQRPRASVPITQPVATVAGTDEATQLRSYQNALSFEAERVLSQIRGAGKVIVSVTTAGGPETVIATNKTQTVRKTDEKDRTGIGRTVEEHTDTAQPVIARLSSAGDRPVVTRVATPRVEGVVVVSAGATDPRVRAEIFKAVQVLFNVPAHKVRVLSMKAGE